MPTKKRRINISLSKNTAVFLKKIALRDDVPEATKASELVEKAMEIEEDEYFAAIADARIKKKGKCISHEEFWAKVL